MPSQKRQFGDKGEREAENFLAKNKYRIIDKNYRIKNIGEIDLIAEKNGKIVFFEVKTRNAAYESNFPIKLSINAKKRKILKKMCELYLAGKRELSGKEWQVDGIFINCDKCDKQAASNNNFAIEHIENILWEKYY